MNRKPAVAFEVDGTLFDDQDVWLGMVNIKV